MEDYFKKQTEISEQLLRCMTSILAEQEKTNLLLEKWSNEGQEEPAPNNKRRRVNPKKRKAVDLSTKELRDLERNKAQELTAERFLEGLFITNVRLENGAQVPVQYHKTNVSKEIKQTVCSSYEKLTSEQAKEIASMVNEIRRNLLRDIKKDIKAFSVRSQDPRNQ